MSRRLRDSLLLTLDATAGEDSHVILPHGFYYDSTTDELWPGSGMICGMEIEASGSGVLTTVEIYDSINSAGARIFSYADSGGGETLAGIRNTTYGGYLHDAAFTAWAAGGFGAHGLLWAGDFVGTQTVHLDDLNIACPNGMIVTVFKGTVAADKVSIIYEPWTSGYTRFNNRNKPHPVSL